MNITRSIIDFLYKQSGYCPKKKRNMSLFLFIVNTLLLFILGFVHGQNYVTSPKELRGLWCIAEWDHHHQVYSRQLGQAFFYNNESFTWNFLTNKSVTWLNGFLSVDQSYSVDSYLIYTKTTRGPSNAVDKISCLWLLRLENGDFRWGHSTPTDPCGNSFDVEVARYSTVYTRNMPHCRLFDDEEVNRPFTFVRFHDELLRFDQALPKEKRNSIVFYGASSFRLWKSLETDFALVPHGVINRGFGGSTLEECYTQFKRVVLPLEPRALLIYAGENDLARGDTPQAIELLFFQLIRMIRQYFPSMPIAFVSIKPPMTQLDNIRERNETNQRIAQMIRDLPNVDYIDVFNPMLTSDHQTRPELYRDDNIHMNREGYEIWITVFMNYFYRKGLLDHDWNSSPFLSTLTQFVVFIQVILLYYLLPVRAILRFIRNRLF